MVFHAESTNSEDIGMENAEFVEEFGKAKSKGLSSEDLARISHQEETPAADTVECGPTPQP
jgi:hypothetical protein